MSKIDSQPANGLERRAFPIEFRQVEEEERSAWATVVTYNTVDDYGSVWMPGCFAESLRTKLPKCTWSHNWSDIIGRVTEYRDGPDRLDVKIQFSDFDAVPRARQAWSQMKSGDVDEMSFGFERQEAQLINTDQVDVPNSEAVERIIKARMYEVSPVLVGAVLGTAVLSVRQKLERAFTPEQIVQLRELLAEAPGAAIDTGVPAAQAVAQVIAEEKKQEPEPGDPGDEEEDDPREEEPEPPKEDHKQLLEEALDAEALAAKSLTK